MKKYLLNFLILFLPICSSAKWIDQSTQLFFPEKEGEFFELYQKMPVTWWNFFFYDRNKINQEQACEYISQIPKQYILISPCSASFVSSQWLDSWAKDHLWKYQPPSSTAELESRLNKSLVRMSLPLPPELLDMQRAHPITDFSLVQKNVADFYKVKENKAAPWGLIPVLFNYSPQETDVTESIEDTLKDFKHKKEMAFIGPHFGSLANKRQIMSDLKKVMGFGLILLIGLFTYLFFTAKKLYFVLIPILFLSLSAAGSLVLLSWGSIHGLSIAFGSGLVGISMDYAFHGWPGRHRSQVWKSNSISFLTTFFAFALLSFFSIPLIKQLSLFSLCGLTMSFLTTYLISLKISDHWRPKNIEIPLFEMRFSTCLIILGGMLVLFATSLFFSRTDFSLVRMDSTQIENQALIESSQQHINKSQYSFLIKSFDDWKSLEDQENWALKNEIPYFGATSLKTSEKSSQKNFQLWREFICTDEFIGWKKNLSPQLQQIFASFLSRLDCEKLKNESNKTTPSYLDIFINEPYALSIFRISKPEHKQMLMEKYPSSFFVTDLTQLFPQKLKTEVLNFIGLVLICVFFLLIVFFKKMAPLVFIPTLGAGTLAFTTHWALGNPLSFMTFIALIILLGLTLDFGIFSTSCLIWKKSLRSTFGSISLSAMTSLAGFAPLAFCSHPVLKDLGMTITAGVLGAFLSTYIIYPGLWKKWGVK